MEQTLQEVKRVLKPDGKFIYIGHVAAPAATGVRRAQQQLYPRRKTADDFTKDRKMWGYLKEARLW